MPQITILVRGRRATDATFPWRCVSLLLIRGARQLFRHGMILSTVLVLPLRQVGAQSTHPSISTFWYTVQRQVA